MWQIKLHFDYGNWKHLVQLGKHLIWKGLLHGKGMTASTKLMYEDRNTYDDYVADSNKTGESMKACEKHLADKVELIITLWFTSYFIFPTVAWYLSETQWKHEHYNASNWSLTTKCLGQREIQLNWANCEASTGVHEVCWRPGEI